MGRGPEWGWRDVGWGRRVGGSEGGDVGQLHAGLRAEGCPCSVPDAG